MQPDEPSEYRIQPEQSWPSQAHVPAAPAYGPPPGYGPPQPDYWAAPPGWYAPAPWGMPMSRRWPYGPDRPGVATAAAVLGFIGAGLTLLMTIAFVNAFATGDGDLPTGLLLLGTPCAVAQIIGGVHVLRRRSRTLLLVGSIVAAAVLVAAFVAAAVTFSTEDFVGITVFLAGAVALPVVTACLAGGRTVRSWLAAAAAGPVGVAPPQV